MIFVARGGGISRRDHVLARFAVLRGSVGFRSNPKGEHRLATRADLPAIVDIYNSVIPERSATCDWEPITVASREAWDLGGRLEDVVFVGLPL